MKVLTRVAVGTGLVCLAAAVNASWVESTGVEVESRVLVATSLAIVAAMSSAIASGASLVMARSVRASVIAIGLTLSGLFVLASSGSTERAELLFTAVPVLAWVGLSLRATVRIRREWSLDPMRRSRQFLLAWCLPYLGAILVLAFYGAEDNPIVDDGFDARPGNHSNYLL